MSSQTGKFILFPDDDQHGMIVADPEGVDPWETLLCVDPASSLFELPSYKEPVGVLNSQQQYQATNMCDMEPSSNTASGYDMWKLEPLQVCSGDGVSGLDPAESSEELEDSNLSTDSMPLKVYPLLNLKTDASQTSDSETTWDSMQSTRDSFETSGHSGHGDSELELVFGADNDAGGAEAMENLQTCSCIAPHRGSVGHPELCTRPCIYFAAGNCANGSACHFCHEPHPYRPSHLDKRHRQMLKEMPFCTCLRLMTPLIKEKAASLHLPAEYMIQLLDTIEAASLAEKRQEGANIKGHIVNSFTQAFRVMSLRSLLSTLKRAAKNKHTLDALEHVLQAMIDWTCGQSADQHGTSDDMFAPAVEYTRAPYVCTVLSHIDLATGPFWAL